jgi:hypothetical protein
VSHGVDTRSEVLKWMGIVTPYEMDDEKNRIARQVSRAQVHHSRSPGRRDTAFTLSHKRPNGERGGNEIDDADAKGDRRCRVQGDQYPNRSHNKQPRRRRELDKQSRSDPCNANA